MTIPEQSGVTQISVSESHGCAIVSGGVQCWGSNLSGQLGDGSLIDRLTPAVAIPAGSGATRILVEQLGRYTCAIINSGLKCWGNNEWGNLGNGTITDQTAPVTIFPEGSGVTDIVKNAYSTCAVVGGSAKCWGWHRMGQLGLGIITRGEQLVLGFEGL